LQDCGVGRTKGSDQGRASQSQHINQSAWTDLILACKENAFNIVASVNDEDAHQAWWIHLKEVFVPNKAIDLVATNQGFTSLKLEDDEEDPKLYVTKLEHVNERYESVDRKYKKG
jgi:hypothetical protein